MELNRGRKPFPWVRPARVGTELRRGRLPAANRKSQNGKTSILEILEVTKCLGRRLVSSTGKSHDVCRGLWERNFTVGKKYHFMVYYFNK